MRTLIPIILLLGLASCATQKRCIEKWGAPVITYRDTVYFVSVDTDTVFNTSYLTDTVFASTTLAGGSAWILRDTLYLKVWQRDTVIEYRDSIKTVERIVQVDKPCPKPKVLNRIVALAVIALFIIIAIKIKV